MTKTVSVITAAAILSGGTLAVLQAQSHAHVMQAEKEVQWGPAPPMLPAPTRPP